MKSTNLLEVRAAGKDEAELLVYGTIGESWWSDNSTSAKSVVDALNALPKSTKTLTVRINSFGGSVADGLAIFNSLKALPARKVVKIDGVAMSIASLIAMAGDDVQIPKTALFMVHAPWSGGGGNAKQMREAADVLDKFAEAMISAYVGKTGKTEDEIRALLTDGEDHFYTGAETVAAGFADTLLDDGAQEASTARALASAPAWIQVAAMAAANRANAALMDVKMPEVDTPVPAPAEPVAEVPAAPTAAVVDAVAAAEARAAEALARLAQVEAALAAEKEAKEVAASVTFVKETFANLPGDPVALGSALRVLAKADPKAHEAVVATLKAANALAAPALEPRGLAPPATDATDSAQTQIDRLVDATMKANPSLTTAAAKTKVYLENPKLVAEARADATQKD